MATSPVDLMACAAKLAGNTAGVEAQVRAAISRAYYAAYHDCVEWYDALPAKGRLPSDYTGNGMHVEFATRLQNPDSSLAALVQEASRKRGVALRKLHGDRVIADYRLKKAVLPMQARSALSDARAIAALP